MILNIPWNFACRIPSATYRTVEYPAPYFNFHVSYRGISVKHQYLINEKHIMWTNSLINSSYTVLVKLFIHSFIHSRYAIILEKSGRISQFPSLDTSRFRDVPGQRIFLATEKVRIRKIQVMTRRVS